MRDTLEIKILEYLQVNENGNFLNVKELCDNTKLLKTKILELKKREILKIKFQTRASTTGINVNFSSFPKCKITTIGIEHLKNLKKSTIDLELAKETLKEFPKTKRRATVAYIIAIILAVAQIIQWIIKLL